MISAVHAIAELLLPRVCPACQGKLIDDEDTICADCLHAIVRTEHATMPDNGVDMLFAKLRKENSHVLHYERGAAWGYYNRERGQVLRQLIEAGKFGRNARPAIFYALGQAAAKEYVQSDLIESVDCLVPIPLSRQRMRERGFNQSQAICEGLSSVWHLPIDTDHLIRVKDNPHQSRSRMNERQTNVEGIFHIAYPEEWKNKHLLLVDDVITSGSTLYAAIRETTPIRGCRISVFTLGWAHS